MKNSTPKLLITGILIGFLPSAIFAQVPFSDYTIMNEENAINTEYNEWFPMVLHDGLTLFFSSDRPGGYGDLDIYVSVRSSVHEPWGEPVNMGPEINSASADHSVTVSDDGHWMLFASERKGGLGSLDLYMTYREDTSDPSGWEEVKHAGDMINSSLWDSCPFFYTEESLLKVYFTSGRGDEQAIGAAYVSTFNDGHFSVPMGLAGMNNTGNVMHFEPSNGLIWANRDGGFADGGDDLWTAPERTGMNKWEKPIPLGENINSSSNEGMPSITSDESLLIFHSDRPGGEGKYDIYFAKPEN